MVVGVYTNTLVGGAWLLSLICASLVNSGAFNRGGRAFVFGWGALALVGIALTLSTPLLILAPTSRNRGSVQLLTVMVATAIGGYAGVMASFALALRGVAWLTGSIAIWTIVSVVAVSFGRQLLLMPSKILRVATWVAAAAAAPALIALLSGTTNTSAWFSQAALAAPVGLGAGAGAFAGSVLAGIGNEGST
jgi:hypothetical protein